MTRLRVSLVGALVATSVFAASALGCAQSPSQKMKSDMEAMRKDSSPEPLIARGDANASVGDMTRAEQYYVAALKAGGNASTLTRKLLAVCAADGRYPVALVYATNYLHLHPSDTDVRFAQAAIYAAVGEVDRARTELDRVVTENPNLADAHFTLASLIQHEGADPLRADRHFREYLRLEPSGPFAEVAKSSLLKSVP